MPNNHLIDMAQTLAAFRKIFPEAADALAQDLTATPAVHLLTGWLIGAGNFTHTEAQAILAGAI